MGTVSYNILDLDLGQYDHMFKLDVDIIDDDVNGDTIWGNGLGKVTIQVRLTTEMVIPMSQNKELYFDYFFGDAYKSTYTHFTIDGSHLYNDEVVYSERVDCYYGRNRHCSTNGIFNFYIEEWCDCVSEQILQDYFLQMGNQNFEYNYISPLDCRERNLYSSITKQPYLITDENGSQMLESGSFGISGTDYFTVDMCLFETNVNLRTWTLDTANYDYELCWTIGNSHNIYMDDRNVLISKGNVVNGDNTISIYPTQTYPNYQWKSTYREVISIFLRKYDGDTLVSETREVMIFTLTYLYNITNISFYDNMHDDESWLATRDQSTYDNYCNTFDENRDFIANFSEFVLNCHIAMAHLSDDITKATLYMDNEETEYNFASGTISASLSLNSKQCDFDFTQNLNTFFLPERMIKRYRLDLTLKNRNTNSTVTQIFYGYFPIIPHYSGICDVVNIYKCDIHGHQLSQNESLQNNYFKIVYNIDCYANELFNENINNYDKPLFEIRVKELPSNTSTTYSQNSYTNTYGTRYYESRGHAYIIVPFTLYREYLYNLHFETPFLNYREYKNSFSSKKPIMNFKSTGNSMAIGKVSENENYLEVGYDIMTTNDNYTLGLRSDNEKLIRIYNNSFASEVNPYEYQKSYDKYTDSQSVVRYPHATTLSIGDSTRSDEFMVIDELRARPIIKYTSQDNHSTDNSDSHSDAHAKYNHLALGCGIIFNNQSGSQYDSGLIKDKGTDDYYRFQNGTRRYEGSTLNDIFSYNSTNVRYIDSGFCLKWGCIVQFYINVALNVSISSGDISDKQLLSIKKANFRPLMLSGAYGGDWGAMSNGVVQPNGNIYISGSSGNMNPGSLCTVSAMYFTRFDEPTDSCFEDCNW